MKLRHITGWGLQRAPCHGPTRLVVYADTQAAPVYVSEEVSMPDPEFGGVDFTRLGKPGSSERLAVRVFEQNDSKWRLIHEIELRLDDSKPWVVDKDFGSVTGPIVVFTVGQHWMWAPAPSKKAKRKAAKKKDEALLEVARPVSTLSYDKLVKLRTLQMCLEDSWKSETTLVGEIAELLPNSSVRHKARHQELQRKLKNIRSCIAQTRQSTARVRGEAERILETSRATSGRLSQWRDKWADSVPLPISVEQLDAENEAMKKERQRLIRGLMEIFPIEPIEQSFHFTICGLPMPSVFSINHYDPVQVGAVLGLIAQLVVLLSRYLDVALPYAIRPYGSQSYIIDTVSKLQGSRTFPLWTKGALLYRVEYGLYLLHKNIEQLMVSQNLAVADLKQTLANLKNLMLVCS